MAERCFFSESRSSTDPRVGFVARRVRGTTKARETSCCNLSSAAPAVPGGVQLLNASAGVYCLACRMPAADGLTQGVIAIQQNGLPSDWRRSNQARAFS
ncbi:MAG: hypothetical protein ACOVSI_08465, partial [Gemmatimonas sp.]